MTSRPVGQEGHCFLVVAHAMLDVIASLYDSINRNQYSGLVLIDLKKAFDTAFHTTLLKK